MEAISRGEGSKPLTARVYIGAGANLGDRLSNLRRGLEMLDATPGVRFVRASPVYETKPWGYTDQSPFLNCAALFQCALGPKQLLVRIKVIEAAMGREISAARWHPRPIDLDLLLYGELVLRERGLCVPHKYLSRRWFMIKPVLDLTPDISLPGGDELAAYLVDLRPRESGRQVAPALELTTGCAVS